MLNWTFKFTLRASTERAVADGAQAVHSPAPGVPSLLWSCTILALLGLGCNFPS